MNFNTFFLDKLSISGQSPSLNLKKGVLSSSLFSDIIKVCELMPSGTNISGTPTGSGTVNQETMPSLDNVIECDSTKLQSISQFIQNFINDARGTVISPEVSHDLNQVVINKKQLIIPAGSLVEFLKELVQKLNLNGGSESESDKKGVPAIFNLGTKIIPESIQPSAVVQKDNKNDDISSDQLEAMSLSLITFLQNNHYLDL